MNESMGGTDGGIVVGSPQASHPMMGLLESPEYGYQPLRQGEIRKGVIVQITPNEILVDLGLKSEGIVTSRDLERVPADFLASLQVGDEVPVYVVNPEDRYGNVILSLSRAQLAKDWERARELYESQEIFPGLVSSYNKGGVIVHIGSVRGFVPASQLDPARYRFNRDTRETPWAELVGQTLQLKVIEIDPERNRLILSERAAIREWRKAQKERLLNELQEGEVRTGQVISLADFGAFVDLGGADGLIHLSELSWKRVNHPREVLELGQEVEVYVLNVDRENKRIGLSLKRLQPDPWTLIAEQYQVGQLVEGVITKLVKFGAFARIKGEEEIEGLIHISELSDDHVTHPQEVVHEGQEVIMRIIRIDTERRRMGLSLKRVADPRYADQDWQAELEAARQEATQEVEEETSGSEEEQTDESGSEQTLEV